MKRSPRQFLPMVQVEEPDSDPRVPIQSELNMKNRPSCETWTMASLSSNLCDGAVMKLCANRQTMPVVGEMPRISFCQGVVIGVAVVHVEAIKGRLSAGSALFQEGCGSRGENRPDGRTEIIGV